MFVDQEGIGDRAWTIEQAYHHCEEIARHHYENFPVGSLVLPKSKRSYIYAIYAFARAADDFADEPGRTPAERLVLLGQWEQYLTDAYSGKASHPVFVALADTVSTLDIPIEPLQRLLTAFKMDVTKNRYETFDAIENLAIDGFHDLGREEESPVFVGKNLISFAKIFFCPLALESYQFHDLRSAP